MTWTAARLRGPFNSSSKPICCEIIIIIKRKISQETLFLLYPTADVCLERSNLGGSRSLCLPRVNAVYFFVFVFSFIYLFRSLRPSILCTVAPRWVRKGTGGLYIRFHCRRSFWRVTLKVQYIIILPMCVLYKKEKRKSIITRMHAPLYVFRPLTHDASSSSSSSASALRVSIIIIIIIICNRKIKKTRTQWCIIL